MSESSQEKWSEGRLVRPTSPLRSPVEVDCSGWESDIPAEKWSTGKLVRVCQSLPPVSGDVIVPAEAYLEITVRLAPDADPGRVMLFTTRMIQVVHDAVPGLGLKYDPVRSRAQAGTVVIGLTSPRVEEAAQKLDALAQAIHALVDGFPMATLNGVRLARAA